VRAFKVSEGTPGEFVERVSEALAERGLDQYVSLRLEGLNLVARFRWMGTTELRYRLNPGQNGFHADLVSERISPLHTPFRQRFEERFDQVLEHVGAQSL